MGVRGQKLWSKEYRDGDFRGGGVGYPGFGVYRARAWRGGVVARAKGMAQVAEQTGLSREQLYRSLSERGNPTLKTTIAVMKALGIELTAKVAG